MTSRYEELEHDTTKENTDVALPKEADEEIEKPDPRFREVRNELRLKRRKPEEEAWLTVDNDAIWSIVE